MKVTVNGPSIRTLSPARTGVGARTTATAAGTSEAQTVFRSSLIMISPLFLLPVRLSGRRSRKRRSPGDRADALSNGSSGQTSLSQPGGAILRPLRHQLVEQGADGPS